MSKKHIFPLIFLWIAVSGCPAQEPFNPDLSPSPGISPTIVPIQSNSPTPNPLVNLLQNNIIEDYYRIDFGPGSKGINTFGPGSKGVNYFGPGSKGVNTFGPGSKGVTNLRFNVNFPDEIVSTELTSFKTQAVDTKLKVKNLNLLLKKGDTIIAKITVLPVSNQFVFGIDTVIQDSDYYNIVAEAENNLLPVKIQSQVKIEDNMEIKVIIYSKDQNPENLDIAIRTKPIKPVQ